ncbi:hypothetical protein SASPL_150382 [Salvia splendens]|uniref:Uncharacterized protein n=1 Tax=Salvia splendens TaxID=180675 RepID=A0A8X8W6H6_SALSN|nr:hypothetical protein SASPL_150382 [Salvia splendens]
MAEDESQSMTQGSQFGEQPENTDDIPIPGQVILQTMATALRRIAETTTPTQVSVVEKYRNTKLKSLEEDELMILTQLSTGCSNFSESSLSCQVPRKKHYRIVPNEEEMCRRFERGLNDNIQKLVLGARENDLTKLSELAQSMEALDSEEGTEKCNKSMDKWAFCTGTFSRKKPKPRTRIQIEGTDPFSGIHFAKDCPIPKVAPVPTSVRSEPVAQRGRGLGRDFGESKSRRTTSESAFRAGPRAP